MDPVAQLLGRFATTMLGPTSTQAVVDLFVGEIVALMDVDGAGAVVLSTAASPGFLSASDARSMEFERLQSSFHDGPCMLAHVRAAAVSVPDLAVDTQFREFTPAARSRGLAGAFAFPLRQGDISLGALDLYRTSSGMLGDADMHTAQLLADVLSAYLASAQTRAGLARAARSDLDTVEDLRARSDERDDALATIIHELVTPLASVTGFLELLEDEPSGFSDRQQHYVAAMQRSTVQLHALTTELLTLFRLEPGAANTHGTPTEVDLRTVLAAAREVLSSVPATRALDVEFEVPEEPVIVNGRQDDLERMLANLVSNAVKYTPAGGTVRCTLRPRDGQASIEVLDTGIGIAEDEHGDLFTKFFRASSARARGIQGTGLGLAIVKAVVQGHGGSIDVFSALGSGTRFVVLLPLARDGAKS